MKINISDSNIKSIMNVDDITPHISDTLTDVDLFFQVISGTHLSWKTPALIFPVRAFIWRLANEA